MSVASTAWYHGGDLKDGKPKGTYLYVTDSQKFAEAHALKHPNGRVYRLRSEHHDLVTDHHNGRGGKVIRQTYLQKRGGALAVFEEV